MASSRLRTTIVTVLLSAFTVTGLATGAQATAWGPMTMIWNDIARGTHSGSSYEYNGYLVDVTTVKDTRADGDPMYDMMRQRSYYSSIALGKDVWNGWSSTYRTEVENSSKTVTRTFGKIDSGTIWQTEHTLWINLNNMPDAHIISLYTKIDY